MMSETVLSAAVTSVRAQRPPTSPFALSPSTSLRTGLSKRPPGLRQAQPERTPAQPDRTDPSSAQRAAAAQAGPPAGPLDHHDGTAQLLLGGLRYSPAVRVLLRYHGTLLMTVTPGTGGRPGAINAVFTGDAGRSRSRACLQWKSSSR